MSVTMYRNKVQGIEKDIASIEKEIGKEQEKLSKALKTIQRTKSTSTFNSKQREVINTQKKIGDLKGKKANKIKSLNQALNQLQRSEAKEVKKNHTVEVRHTKAITDELKKQQRISQEISANSISINFESLPEKINVLFLASNPIDQSSLRLDQEIRLIHEKIRASEYRDSINLQSRWAVRSNDILQAINEVQPHIIHFSGHGSLEHDIVLETTEGTTSLLSKEAVTLLMKTMSDSIKLVIFNNCFSSGQAEAVTEHIDCAIGMNEAVYDDAAREFAAQFYSAIAFGKSIQNAFEQGKLALILAGLKGDEIPELYTRAGLDPGEILLVKPAL
ncbi:CHAT domain-containing protein [Ornithinibacillus californiensis]|uniref:CHAT domain-containing protein n=1 Tax=Ornithinibacillus californiensis TaxID=161536 RepID=UPI00064DD09A|nr:CHAT domain-containing protein [Ornithinibacillus californiensis]